MSAKALASLALFLILPLLMPAAGAQPGVTETKEVLILDAVLEPGLQTIARLPGTAIFNVRIRDASIETVDPTVRAANQHLISGSARITTAGSDWLVNFPFAPDTIYAGDTLLWSFTVIPPVSTPYVSAQGELFLNLTGSATEDNVHKYTTLTLPFAVRILPSPAAFVSIDRSETPRVGPYERHSFVVSALNLDAYPATFRAIATIQASDGIPADTPILVSSPMYLEPGETGQFTVTVVTPRDLFWYRGEQMLIFINVQATTGGAPQTTTYTVELEGFYVSDHLIMVITAFLFQLALVIFLIIFAKRRYERRYLGRPVPPWTIPEERANLDRLKKENPRAHYVLRYFLMEEEYRSALLWFFAYKKVSKKQLKAEIRSVRLRERADEIIAAPTEGLDRRFARIERRFERRIERSAEATQGRLDRLQAKLDRNFEKDHEKDHEKWEKKVEKLQAKHDKPFAKAHKKWKKETEKILADWEKPFRRKKARYEKRLAKAKEAYAKTVKRKDKATWKAWRELHLDWEEDAQVRKKEGQPALPEPELFSQVVGPPELPQPLDLPPKPALPAEPRPARLTQLPPEPQLLKPSIDDSHYAKKAKKIRKVGQRDIRKIEAQMAEKLEHVNQLRHGARDKILIKRDKYLEDSEATAEPGLWDRMLRRTPQQTARRHQVSYIKGLTKERVAEATESERARVERVRHDGARREAELQAQIIRAKGELRMAAKRGVEADRVNVAQRIATLTTELDELKRANVARLTEEEGAAKARLAERVRLAKKEEAEALKRVADSGKPTPAAGEPTRT